MAGPHRAEHIWKRYHFPSCGRRGLSLSPAGRRHHVVFLDKTLDSRLRSEALLKFEGNRCSDNRLIFVPVANGNIIERSKCKANEKIVFEICNCSWKAEIFAAKCYLYTILLGNPCIFTRLFTWSLADVFGWLQGQYLNTLRLFI